MRKFVALILVTLYFTSTSGMVFNVHYCMGKISSVTVNNFSKEVCNICKSKTQSDCCKTELKVVKLNETHQQTTVDDSIATPSIALTTLVTTNFISYNSIAKPAVALTPSPPLIEPDICVENCSFLI